MAGAGSVAWIFEKKGLFVVKKAKASEETLMDVALSAGAEDLTESGDQFEITSGPQDFEAVKQALTEKKIALESAQLTMIPKNQVPMTAKNARVVMSLVNSLEDHDDVQNVYANFEIPDEVMKEIS